MRLLGQKRKWLATGAWAIVEHALFALGNFTINLLLARWLAPAVYGEFAIAFSILLLVGAFHRALIVEPMMVFGPQRQREGLRAYYGALLIGHLAFSLAASTLLLIAAAVLAWFDQSIMANAMFIVAGTAPFILFLWQIRQACYVQNNARTAAVAGAGYLVLMLLAIVVLFHQNRLSTSAAFIIMAGASLITGVILALRLGIARSGRRVLWQALAEHWRYGSWAAATRIFMWVPANLYYVVLPLFASVADTAGLKAVMNLLMPVQNMLMALSTVLLPALVRHRSSARFNQIFKLSAIGFTAIAASNWLALAGLHSQILSWAYAGQYDQYGNLLWIAGALPVCTALIAVLGGTLRAVERPDKIFWAYVAATAVTVTLGMALIAALGVAGALTGLLLSSVTTVIVIGLFLRSEPLLQPRAASGHAIGLCEKRA